MAQGNPDIREHNVAGLVAGPTPGARRYKSTGGGTTTTVQSADPWAGQQPYLAAGFEAAKTNVLDRPQQYYPGETVVPFTDPTQAALGAQTNRAYFGSPLLSGAQGYTGDVLGGSYLDSAPGAAGAYTSDVLSGEYLDPSSNPFMARVSDAVLSVVQPQVAGTFARAGRTGGSPLAAEALGRGVSRGMAPYLFGEYGRERGIMEGAAGREYGRFGRERGIMEGAAARAPALAREDYYDIDRMRDVGRVREGKTEESIADAVARWNFTQQEPVDRVAQYMSLIQGNYGGTTTGSQTANQSANTGMVIAGTALRAAGK